VIGFLLLALIVQARSPKPCVLNVGGKKVGYVPTPRAAQRAKDEVEKRFRRQFGNDARFQHEVMWYPDKPPERAKFLTLEQAVDGLSKAVRPLVKATVIEVDGEPLIVVKSRSMAEDVVRQYMARYAEQNAPASGEVPRTKEKVNYVDRDDVDARGVTVDVRKALEQLSASGATDRYYVTVEGDTGYGVAYKAKLTLEQLQGLNPNVNLARLKIGQRLCVQRARGALTVVTVHEYTRTEDIPAPLRTVSSNRLPTGEREVDRQGKSGKREVTYRETRENGVSLGEEEVGDKILSRPETRVEVVGTG
jgi:LysM repeat protein